MVHERLFKEIIATQAYRLGRIAVWMSTRRLSKEGPWDRD